MVSQERGRHREQERHARDGGDHGGREPHLGERPETGERARGSVDAGLDRFQDRIEGIAGLEQVGQHADQRRHEDEVPAGEPDAHHVGRAEPEKDGARSDAGPRFRRSGRPARGRRRRVPLARGGALEDGSKRRHAALQPVGDLRPDRRQFALGLDRARRIQGDRHQPEQAVDRGPPDVDALHALVGEVERRLLEHAFADEESVAGDPEPEARPLNRAHYEGQQEHRPEHEEQNPESAGIVPHQGYDRDQRDQGAHHRSRQDPEDVSGEEEKGEGGGALPIAGVRADSPAGVPRGFGGVRRNPRRAPRTSIRSEM